MKVVLAIFFCSVLLISCDRQGYKDITQVDDQGVAITPPDPTDWTFDEKLKRGIEELLEEGCELEGVGPVGPVEVFSAYPNPTSSFSFLTVSVSDTTLMRYAIVDKRNTLYERGCRHLSVGYNIFQFDIANLPISIGGRYRLYYAFVDQSNTIYYKGHGDIHLK